VSSGGTAQTLRDAGIPVTPVEEVTGSPEMLDGRVKTLHPRIHAGILADRRKPEHDAELAEHGIEPFELVVVNLYPFRETVASGAGPEDVIEKIDIGGPTMVRAAAKNFGSVGIVVRLEEELLDAVTGLSGSGPAYLFYLAEAMVDAGLAQGLPPAVADRLVRQTLLGAAALLDQSDDAPQDLRGAVTSKGGTTESAVALLDERDVRGAIIDAIGAATERSRELGAD